MSFHIFHKFNCTDPGLQLTLHSLVCCCGFADILNILENRTLSSSTSPYRQCKRVPPPLPPGEKVPLMGGASHSSPSQGGRRSMLHPTPTPPNIELFSYISCDLVRFIYFPLKYNLNTSFVRITRHFRYRQLFKYVAFHDRRA